MSNRITAAFEAKRVEIANRLKTGLATKAGVAKAASDLDMDVEEFCMFQELKTLAVGTGLLTADEGMTVYAALGTVPTVFNAQPVWVKAVLTGLFRELLAARLAQRRAR